jgi:hypothetical protein
MSPKLITLTLTFYYNQIPETQTKETGFLLKGFWTKPDISRNPVSQGKRDRAETGFLLQRFSIKPDISQKPGFSKETR